MEMETEYLDQPATIHYDIGRDGIKVTGVTLNDEWLELTKRDLWMLEAEVHEQLEDEDFNSFVEVYR